MQIDLNADVGEGLGPWKMGEDSALFDIISSANIACGFHAGDPLIMSKTLKLAKLRGIEIGAHVGFPDLQGFGRRVMHIDIEELSAMVVYQLGALAGLAQAAGCRMTHMSFHGALGNMVAADPLLANPLIKAVADYDSALIVSSSSSRAIEDACATYGLTVATSFLADRAYDKEGLLVPRKLPNSVIHDKQQVLARIKQLLETGTVTTYTNEIIAAKAQSILVHGDTPGSVALAQAIRLEIEKQGGKIVPISQQISGLNPS